MDQHDSILEIYILKIAMNIYPKINEKTNNKIITYFMTYFYIVLKNTHKSHQL